MQKETQLKPKINYSIYTNKSSLWQDCGCDVQGTLERLGINIHKRNAGGYWVAYCPFHKAGQEKKPSLNIHSGDGHFKCHSCGEAGNGLPALVMKLKGISFREACNLLKSGRA